MDTDGLLSYLEDERIAYERFDHPAVFTVEEAKQKMDIPYGADTKNLFLRDRKARRHLLVVVGYDKNIDSNRLGKMIGTSRLTMASPDRLRRILGVEPGSVSLFALVNDREGLVEVLIDRPVWGSDHLRGHPLRNTSSLVVPRDDMHRFIRSTGHDVRIMDIPAS